MRRTLAWLGAIVLLLPLVLAAGLGIALNSAPGRSFAESLVARFTADQVVIRGLAGRFPDALRLAHLEVRDAAGAWLEADDVALDWSPTALLHRQALVHRLAAARLLVARPPLPAGASTNEPGGPFKPPLRVTVEQVAVGRVELGQKLLGVPGALTLTGQADVPTAQTGTLGLRATDPGNGASYVVDAAVTADAITASIELTEPVGGLLARLAALPDIGALHLTATASGPRTALSTTLALTAGQLTARGTATIDLQGATLVADLAATAPAMTPAPGVSWRSIDLGAHVAGPFTAPDATGRLRVDSPAVAGATLRALTADLAGNAGRVTVTAVAEALRLPAPNPALLEAAPLRLTADIRLDDPARPLAFTLDHPLLAVAGTARTAAPLSARATMTLPDLAPLASLAGIEAAGRTALTLEVAQSADALSLAVDGTLNLTAAPGPAVALMGPAATLALTARVQGDRITLDRLALDGALVHLAAKGTSTPAGLDVEARAAVDDLGKATPALDGMAALVAHVTGPPSNLAVDAVLTGDVGAHGVPRAPIRVTAALSQLPGAPTGRIAAQGAFAGAPVDLSLTATRSATGTLHATIDRATWRSLLIEGDLTLAPGATLPTGRVALRMPHLEELRPLLNQPVGGALSATADLTGDAVTIEAEARNAGTPAARVGLATLKARVTSPLQAPVIAASLVANQVAAGAVTASLRLDANGPRTAVALKASGTVHDAGTEAQVAATALLDAAARVLRLDTLQLTAATPSIKAETVRLLAPATLRFADAVSVDRLRLGLRQATLDVAGRLSPTLDATVALRAPAEIAAIVAPDTPLDGTIALDARLTGTPAQPLGSVKLSATNLRLRTGPGRAAPPANLVATVTLAQGPARIDARLTAGSAQLAVTGTAPLGAGALALRATGALDLGLLDPILTASGRRARGRLALDATVGGTVAAPQIGGTAQLAGGELEDFDQGVRVTDLAGTIRLQGPAMRADLTGRAGPGTLAVAGTVGIADAAHTVDLAITLRNARPLASDTISADLDADLTLRGPAAALTAGGRVVVRRAELRIPRTLPASVVVLDVRRPGARPPAAAAGAPIRLDLAIDAPQAVYVRGRGVDAELSGALRIQGTSTAPQVGGGLALRRGSISLAGTTLAFTRGKVGFDGTGVTGKIDPTLDFAADSSAGAVTATLAIGGYVSKPKITLTSVPDLPQDEVLAYLLFKRSAKELGPFQIAEIAAGLAELTGVGGGGLNPLESVRKGLGLDRLSVGAGATPGTGSASSAPTIEAGRYVANGVYVGAKQGTTGGQTQATVQIDITKGLKVETDVGAGQGGSQVGLTYQFEY